MKKMIKNLMLVAVAAMAFVGCQNDNDEMNVTVKKTVFEFTANIEETTRSYFGEKEGNTYPTLWEGTEYVRLVAYDETDAIVSATGATVEAEEGATTAKITATFEGELTDVTKLVAYIGSWNYDDGTLIWNDQFASQVGKVNHTLISENEWDGKSAAVLNFSHAVAYGNMTITDSPVAISDLAKVIVTLDGVEYSIGIGDMLESLNIWFACEPNDALSTLTVSLVDKNGVTYSKSVNMTTLPVGSKPLKFIKGHVSKFSISGFEKEPADHAIEFTEREYIGDKEDYLGNFGSGYKFSNDAGDQMVIYFGTTSTLTTGVYTWSNKCESGCFLGTDSYITLGGSQKYLSNGQVALTIENELWHLVYTGTINGETYEATFSQFNEGVYEATIDSVEGSFNEWQNVFSLSFVTTDGDDFGVYSLDLDLTPATAANGIIPAGTYTVGASMGSNILGGMAGPNGVMSNLTAGTIIVEHGDKSYTFTIDVTNAAKTQIKATYTGRVEGVYDDFIHPGDATKLATPQNVKATVIASYDEPAIEITWEAVENAYEYLVTCKETSDVNTINHEHECSTIFSSLDYDTTYNFTIVAYPVSESTEYKASDPVSVSAKTALNPATPADYEITLTKVTAIDGNTISFAGDNAQDNLKLVFNPGLAEIVDGTYIPAPQGLISMEPYNFGTMWSSDSALEIGTNNETSFNISSNYNQYGYYPNGGAVVTVSISGTTYTIVALLKEAGSYYKFTYTGKLEVSGDGPETLTATTLNFYGRWDNYYGLTSKSSGVYKLIGENFDIDFAIHHTGYNQTTGALVPGEYTYSYNAGYYPGNGSGYDADDYMYGGNFSFAGTLNGDSLQNNYNSTLVVTDSGITLTIVSDDVVVAVITYDSQSAEPEPEQLDTPTGLVATPDVNTVTVNWNAVANAESYDVTCGVNKLTVEGTTATFDGLEADATYEISVVAKADGYEDSPAATTTVTTLPAAVEPDSIVLTTITPLNETYDPSYYTWSFNFTDGTDNNKFAIAFYYNKATATSIVPGEYTFTSSISYVDQPYFALDGRNPYYFEGINKKLTTGSTVNVAVDGSVYTINMHFILTDGSEHDYKYVGEIVVEEPEPEPEPEQLATPTGLKATPDVNEVTVSWNAVEYATSYDVTCGAIEKKDVTDLTATFTGLTANTEYTVTVVAKANGYVDSPAASIPVTTKAAGEAKQVSLTFFTDNGTSYIFKGNDGHNYLIALRNYNPGTFSLTDSSKFITSGCTWTENNTTYFGGTQFAEGDTLELINLGGAYKIIIRATVAGEPVVATCESTTFS